MLAACSSDPDSPPDLRNKLQSDTGTEWAVFSDPRSLEVRFLAPVRPVVIGNGSPEEKARAFFERYRDQLQVGGTNTTSGVSVAKGIGWKAAREIWYETLTALRPQATFSDAALAQVNAAWRRGPEVALAVGCAWYAVGVVDTTGSLDPRLALLVCPPAAPAAPPPPGGSSVNEPNPCAGHGDHLVCDSFAPATAVVCKSGVRVNIALCADPGQRCRKTSESDPTASLGSDGALVCE